MELATAKQVSYINHLAGDTSYTAHGSLQKFQASKIIDRLVNGTNVFKGEKQEDIAENSKEWACVSLMHSKNRTIDAVMEQRDAQKNSPFGGFNTAYFDAAISNFYK